MLEQEDEEMANRTRPWQNKLVVLRLAYFFLGFWCGIIAILLILIVLNLLYGFS